MRILDGEFKGNEAIFIKESKRLDIQARLLVVQQYQLPKDMQSIELLEKETYHSLEQWLIMLIAALTVIGLLVSIPLYIWGKKLRFTVRFTPKKDDAFTAEGNKQEWQALKGFI